MVWYWPKSEELLCRHYTFFVFVSDKKKHLGRKSQKKYFHKYFSGRCKGRNCVLRFDGNWHCVCLKKMSSDQRWTVAKVNCDCLCQNCYSWPLPFFCEAAKELGDELLVETHWVPVSSAPFLAPGCKACLTGPGTHLSTGVTDTRLASPKYHFHCLIY